MAWQKTRINLPSGLNPKQRKKIAEDILVHIQELAINEGKGFSSSTKRERSFPDYTVKYAKKKGTSVGDVDLVLKGDMFTAMRLLSHNAKSLLLGFTNGTKQNSKAEGNQTGSYGGSADSSKARMFLGISKIELDRIIKKHDSKNRSEEISKET